MGRSWYDSRPTDASNCLCFALAPASIQVPSCSSVLDVDNYEKAQVSIITQMGYSICVSCEVRTEKWYTSAYPVSRSQSESKSGAWPRLSNFSFTHLFASCARVRKFPRLSCKGSKRKHNTRHIFTHSPHSSSWLVGR